MLIIYLKTNYKNNFMFNLLSLIPRTSFFTDQLSELLLISFKE